MKTTQTSLKLFAMATMLIDHTGAILFPEITLLRVIGRLSFPIFAFLIANGYEKTRSFSAYTGRLLIFAAISQIPFSLAFHRYDMPNVLFTLSSSLLALRLYDDMKDSGRENYGLLTVFLIAIAVEAANCDWGFFGVALVFLFHIFKVSDMRFVISSFMLTLAFDSYKAATYMAAGAGYSAALFYSFIHMAWFPSILPLRKYGGERGGLSISGIWPGKVIQLSFYAFYPLHLLLLYAFSLS
jgi:hypothetical protein